MTKTIRKGLIAVLLFVMTVLVGVASWTALGGTARAAANPDHVEKMKVYIEAFDDVTIDKKLFDKSEANNKLWKAYDDAKTLYSDLTTDDKTALREIKGKDGKDLLAKLEELDVIFGDAYNYVAKIKDSMFKITTKPVVDYIKDKPAVVNFRAEIKAVEDGQVEDKENETDWVGFIKYLTNDYEYLRTAEALMTVVESYFAEIDAEILKIEVYNTTDSSFAAITDTKGTDEHFVLDSETTVKNVTDLLKRHYQGVKIVKNDDEANETLKAALALLDPYKLTVSLTEDDVKGKTDIGGGAKSNVEHYNYYQDAVDTIAALKALVDNLINDIDTVYDKVVDGEVYYSYINDIKAARAAYNAFDQGKAGGKYTGIVYKAETKEIDWANTHLGAWGEKDGEHNFNDLQSKVKATNHTCGKAENKHAPAPKVAGDSKAALEIMEAYIGQTAAETEAEATGLMKKIEDAEKAVAAIKTADENKTTEGVSQKYTVEYKALIDAARAAVKALDEDIQAWDEYFYYMSLADDEKPQEAVTYDTAKYGTHFPEYAEDVGTEGSTAKYIVDEYNVLKKAEKQWADWEKQIDDLVDKVKALIEKYNTLEERQVKGETRYVHPAIAVEFNAIKDAYAGLTKEQQYAFDWGFGHDGKAYNPTKDNADGTRMLEFKVRKQQAEEAYEYPLGETKRQPKLIVDWFDSKLKEIYTTIGDLSTNIDALYNKNMAKGECVFDDYATLKALEDEYKALSDEVQQYVPNYEKLVALREEYDKEKALVDDWLAADAIKDTFGEVTVWNMNKVEEAIKLWNALLHQSDPVEKLPGEGLGKLQTIVSTQYADEYAAYTAVVKKYDTLVEDLQKLAVSMNSIECKADLPLKDVPDWSKNVTDVETKFNKFATSYIVDKEHTKEAGYPGKWWSADKGTVAFSYDKAGTEPAEKVNSTYAKAYENYLKALQYNRRYHVECLINELYENDKTTGYTEAVDKLIADGLITLNSKEAVEEAKAAYDEYVAAEPEGYGGSRDDIRNHTKLEKALAALSKIGETLDAWRKEVLKFYNATNATGNNNTAVELAEDAGTTAISAAIASALKNLTKGYSVDLAKYVELLAAGEALYSAETYPDDAKARENWVSDAMELLKKLKELSDQVIEKFNSDITRLKDSYETNDSTLTPEELEEVADMNELYSKLHPSQQKLIDDFNSFKDLVDELKATEAFVNMVKELYRDVVTDGNVTSLTMYYVDVIEAIYNQFTTEVRTSFENKFDDKSYEEMIEEIKKAYNKAVEDEAVLSLKGLDETVKGIKENFATSDDLAGAIEDAKTALQAAYEKAINDAVDAAKKELQGSIDEVSDGLDDLNEAIAELKKAEAAAKKEGYTGLADKIDKQIKALNDAITALQSRATDLERKQEELEKDLADEKSDREKYITDLSQKLQALKDELGDENKGIQARIDSAVNALKSSMQQELQDAIDELKDTTLKGLLDAQQKAEEEGRTDIYDALDHSVKEVNDKIAELQESLDAVGGENGTVAQLQSQIADLGRQLAEAGSTNSSAQTELRGALTELESKMDKADADLQAQIDKLGSTTNALTAVIIVLAVVLVGAVVCIVLLFLKRNKQ